MYIKWLVNSVLIICKIIFNKLSKEGYFILTVYPSPISISVVCSSDVITSMSLTRHWLKPQSFHHLHMWQLDLLILWAFLEYSKINIQYQNWELFYLDPSRNYTGLMTCLTALLISFGFHFLKQVWVSFLLYQERSVLYSLSVWR